MCEGRNNTCKAPWTNTTLSDHRFCTGCRIEHDSLMAAGLGKRAIAGDWYLIPEALGLLDEVRKFAAMLESEIRQADLESDGHLDPEAHEDDFAIGDEAFYNLSATEHGIVRVIGKRSTDNGVEYNTLSEYGMERWVRWSKLTELVTA